ncbi:50S ribosomal protein L24 [bacterium (Candidatus Gribaldobacteria) CG_4_10_14_0_8_um_filter_33_9]|uniref:Large ribosomal subunit protein uL24 n=1 Tax=bacterium (Candidatus Gribaldobacteria) CG_4_10_14_0_8_um_filter_33_9 TaxID=2014266 RepID=A0A2M7RN59_9BACT|nr:MAG: 50S ribosomal protein L24 [bacterium (Candidatus Gribaldobacteria) CG_4_10_14_0_8_um_filter_33_9]
MKIKKNDQVLIIKGKDKGKKGKVLSILPKSFKVLVEGVNVKKKHQRPRKQGEKGQVIEKIAPLPVSNLKLICLKCGKPVRIGYKIAEKKKFRICKKCGEEI